MSALALRLLLILSLVFNAVAAPWAMAQMQHDGHAHRGVPVDAGSPQRQHAAGHQHATMPHASPHDHSAMLRAAANDHGAMSGQASAHEDGSCCDEAMCQCGCILPPAVAFLVVLALEPQPSLPVDMARAALSIVARGSPPFRPPAV